MFTVKVLNHGGSHNFYEARHVTTGTEGHGGVGVGWQSRQSEARVELYLSLADGSLETVSGPGVAYIMNENGATVAKYELLETKKATPASALTCAA